MKNGRLFSGLLACLLSMNACFAAQGEEETQNNNEIIVLTPEEELETEARRSCFMQSAFVDQVSNTLRNLDDNDNSYLYRIYPSANYFPIEVSGSKDKIRLHDGSLWYVHPADRNIIGNWVTSDKLFIKPNASCFSSYSYVFQNRKIEDKDKRIVRVNLLEGPINTGAYTRWIIDIDRYRRLVYLNDNTVWYINPKDTTFNRWAIGHRLIIGVNNRWRTAEYPHVLLNTGIYRAPYCEADLIAN